MKIFSSKQIREIDSYTIENEPVPSIDLMERAAQTLAEWFRTKYVKSNGFVFMAGPGNNGGDAWALARILFHDGFENIRFYLLGEVEKISPDSQINRKRLIDETDIRVKTITKEEDFPFLSEEEWIVDGLFGSGLSRAMEGITLELVDYINSSAKAGVVAIDIPSGLFADDNSSIKVSSTIQANYTLCFQFPKKAFFFAENDNSVGTWMVLPIGLHKEIIKNKESQFYYLSEEEAKLLIQPRSKFTHKGTYGHALIIAGSYGMMGASVLATKAAVRGGAGLVTTHVPRLGYEIIQTAIPEALVSIEESDLIFTEVNNLDKYTAVAVGPGINTKANTEKALKELIANCQVPLVIDADAINILSSNKESLETLPINTILTPHPGEFDRLTKKHLTHFDRVKTQIDFAKKYKVVIVLKGAHSSIAFPDGRVWFNSTGNPGMATGGSGDVLTGLLCSLLAQGYDIESATKLAVFIHGLAGDIAFERKGYHALSASDIINNLGRAFKKLEVVGLGLGI